MLTWLRKKLFPTDKELGWRLTHDEVLAIARTATSDERTKERLGMINKERHPDKRIWNVATATKGSWFEVRVNDETGKVISAKRVGIR